MIFLLNEINTKITVTNEEILLYHTTSWDSIFRILRRIEPRSRDYKATDFGMYNFYTNNSFKAAYHWSKRFEQSGIIIFKLPRNFISSLDKYKELNHIDKLEEWKNIVFNCRNQSNFGDDFEADNNYQLFIKEIDSFKCISGPIFANPDTEDINQVDYIRYKTTKYNRYNQPIVTESIPYQISFKHQDVCDILRNHIELILFFQE